MRPNSWVNLYSSCADCIARNLELQSSKLLTMFTFSSQSQDVKNEYSLILQTVHFYLFLWVCLTRLTETPDNRPCWAKRAEDCHIPADCACVFVLKHPRETHGHAAISTARSSILCPACSTVCQTCRVCVISDWMCWKPSNRPSAWMLCFLQSCICCCHRHIMPSPSEADWAAL